MAEETENPVPQHVAIIMDGNGRWAKKRLLPRSAGHRAGMKRMIPLLRHIYERGVKYVTLYALSTENLSRPKEEVDALFALFREYFSENVSGLEKNGIRLRVIGDRSLLPQDIVNAIEEGERRTQAGTTGMLILAIAYGARNELMRAAAMLQGKHCSEEEFSALLYTAGVPDPELLIRTGGEMRLSNFLLWQCAYAELYFSGKMFPDFTNSDFDRALKEYSSRERRFGKVKS